MEKTKPWIVLGLLAIVLASPARALGEREIQWTDSTRLALAQCFVAEAGWGAATEYAAIAHVLKRRWLMLTERPEYESLTFEQHVRQYCAVHRVGNPTARQLWVRKLPWGDLKRNPGFEDGVSWENFAKLWTRVQDVVKVFEEGLLVDPLPRAWHWGGPMDTRFLRGKRTRALSGIVTSIETGKRIQLMNRFYTAL